MKIMNRCFNISKVSILVIVAIALFSIILIAGVTDKETNSPSLIDNSTVVDSSTIWKPTKEDIAYQDSMFSIVEQTSLDVDTIKKAIDVILYKIDKLEYQ